MTCRCDIYNDEYEVIKAFQAKATRRELYDKSTADFYLFSQSFADALWETVYLEPRALDILGENLSRIHSSTAVTRTPSTGVIYAVMG